MVQSYQIYEASLHPPDVKFSVLQLLDHYPSGESLTPRKMEIPYIHPSIAIGMPGGWASFDGNAQLYSARYSHRRGRCNLLNVWSYGGNEMIPEEDESTGYFDVRVSWTGVYDDVNGLFCGILRPKTYGAAMMLRNAQEGPEMPLQGSKECRLITKNDKFETVNDFYPSAPATPRVIPIRAELQTLAEHSPLYFGSPFSNTNLFRPHWECEAYLQLNPDLSDIVDLNSLHFIPHAIIDTNQVENQSSNFSSVLTAYDHPDIFRRLYENLNCRVNHEIPEFATFYDYREHPRFRWYYYLKGILMYKWITSDLRVWYHRFKRLPAKCHYNNINADRAIDEMGSMREDGENDFETTEEKSTEF